MNNHYLSTTKSLPSKSWIATASTGKTGFRAWLSKLAILVLVFTLSNYQSVQAQLNYSWAQTSGLTYSSLVGQPGITTLNSDAQLLLGFADQTQDDGGVVVTLPFTFIYNGGAYTEMSMCTNGWLSAGNVVPAGMTGSQSRAPGSMFTSTVPNNTIAGWWFDGGSNWSGIGVGTMSHGLVGTGIYAFQWNQVNASGFSSAGTTTNLISYQINIYGPTSIAPGRIDVIYGPQIGTLSAGTIGIENSVGGTGNYINGVNGLTSSAVTQPTWPGNGNGYRYELLPPCTYPTFVTSATALTPNSTKIKWAVMPTATSYNIQYRTPIGTGPWTTVTSTSDSIILVSLLSNTQYDVQVQAVCGGPTSTFSNTFNFTTLPAPCDIPPTVLSSSSIDPNSNRIKWTLMSGAVSYVIQYRSPVGTGVWNSVTSTSDSVILVSLLSNSPYEVQVQSVCSGILSSAFSSSLNFTTIPGPCDVKPTNVSSSAITYNSATLTWDNMLGANNYTIQYRTTSPVGPYTTVTSPTASVNITGLLSSKQYEYQIRTNCTSSPTTSPFSTALTFTTLQIPCFPPANQATGLLLTIASPGVVNGSFTPASSSPSGYLVVRYKSGQSKTDPSNGTTYVAGNLIGSGVVISAGTATSFVSSGLYVGSTYTYYVYDYNNASCNTLAYNVTSPLTGNISMIVAGASAVINPDIDGGFENGNTFASNGWSFDNGLSANAWTVGTLATLFSTGTNNSAYIINNGTFSYNTSLLNNVHFWRDVTIPAGQTEITLSFNWYSAGEANFDAWQVSVGSTSITPIAQTLGISTSFTQPLVFGATVLGNGSIAASSVQTSTFCIPQSLVGNETSAKTIRIIFSWHSDTSVGTQPPAAIDNVYLLASTPLAPTTQANSLNFVPASNTQINATFNAAAVSNPVVAGYLVVGYPAGSAVTDPVNSTTYSAGQGLGLGKVYYVGAAAASNAPITGLIGNTAYDFYVYTYSNNTCSGTKYNKTSVPTTTVSTNSCAGTPIPAGTYPIHQSLTGNTPALGFSSITAAAGYLLSNGIAGNVIFELQSGYTSALAGESFPISFNGVCGISSTRRITVRPAAAYSGIPFLISGSNATAIFDINNTSYLTIDGRPGGVGTATSNSGIAAISKLTIVNTNAAAIATVRINSDASNNTITYCDIQGQSTTSTNPTTSGVIFIGQPSSVSSLGNDNNTISFCNIHATSGGFPAVGIGMNGTATAPVFTAVAGAAHNNDNNTITNCNIYDFFTAIANTSGIKVDAFNNSTTITNNHFYQTNSRTFTTTGFVYRGIWLTPNGSGLATLAGANNNTVTGNYIGGNSASGTGLTSINTSGVAVLATFQGMDISVGLLGAPTSILTDTVANISFTTPSAVASGVGSFTGIGINYGNISNLSNCVVGGPGNPVTAPNGPITFNATCTACTTTVIPLVNGIRVGGGTSLVNLTMNGNKVQNITNSNAITALCGAHVWGISIDGSCNDNTVISNNEVSDLTAGLSGTTTGTSGQLMGIRYIPTISTPFSAQISSNLVHDLKSYNANVGTTTAAGLFGIIFNTTNTFTYALNITGNKVYNLDVANNVASTATSPTFSPSVYGIASITANFASTEALDFKITKNLVHSINISNWVPASTPSVMPVIGGIYLGNGSYTVSNNMVRLGVDGAGADITKPISFIGIVKNGSAMNYIWHNSVYIGGKVATSNTVATGILSAAFQRLITASLTSPVQPDIIQNNIFVNKRTNNPGVVAPSHYAVALTSGNTFATITNNVYDYVGSSSNNFAAVSTSDFITYTPGWVSTDLVSKTGNPQFVNPTGNVSAVDLHIKPSPNPTPIEATGTTTSTAILPATSGTSTIPVTIDYDNQTRSSFGPTDIGADADNFQALLACVAPVDQPTALSFSSITQTSALISFAAAPSNPDGYLIVRYPAGAATTNPQNGVNYVAGNALGLGTVVSVGSTVSNIFAANLVGSTTYDIFVYALNSNCSGGPAYNVTSPLNTPQLTTLSCGAGLSGTKTVGGASPDYTSLTTAFADINTKGLSGSLILELKSGYAGEPAYPLVIGSYCGASASKTITIRPQAGANGLSITSGAGGTVATIDFRAAKYVTIDGRPGGTGVFTPGVSLTINNTLGTLPAVRFIDEAFNDTIKYCDLKADNNTATTGAVVQFAGYTGTAGLNGNDNNVISFCDIHPNTAPTLTTGILFQGVYSAGTSIPASAYNDNNKVSDCNIYNIFSPTLATNGIFLSTANGSWSITNNKFYQTGARTYSTANTHRLIQISTAGSGFIITGNYIGGNSAAGTGLYTVTNPALGTLYNCIDVSAGVAAFSEIQNNTITNIDFSSNSTSPSAFIGIRALGGNINIGTTTANLIGSTTATGIAYTAFGSLGGVTGIQMSGGNIVNISNNAISGIVLSGTTVSTAISFTGISLVGGTYANCINNTIGSSSVTNSINAPTLYNSTAGQVMRGIVSSGVSFPVIQGNLIANMNMAFATTVVSTSGSTMAGIVVTAGNGIVRKNTIRNFTSASQGTGANATTTVAANITGIAYTSTVNLQAVEIDSNTIHSLTVNPAISQSVARTAVIQIEGIYVNGPGLVPNGYNWIHAISRNNIHSLWVDTLATDTSAIVTGIEIAAGFADISNNMVRLGYDKNGGSITTGYTIRGIYKNTQNANNFYHNSVYIGGRVGLPASSFLHTKSDSRKHTYAFLRSKIPVTVIVDDIRNNIFENDRANATLGATHYGLALAWDAAGVPASAITGINLNYNVYQTLGTGGKIGRFETGSAANLFTDFAAYTPGWISTDLTSYPYSPKFINPTGSAATGDLHISSNILDSSVVEHAGQLVSSITKDIDGQVRTGLTPVDIGADAGNFVAYSCTGTPNPGLISTTTPSICPGSKASMILAGYTGKPGISFQWQESSTPGGPYTNVSVGGTTVTSGTSFAYNSAAISTTKYYVCNVACLLVNQALSPEKKIDVGTPSITSAPSPVNRCGQGTVNLTATANAGSTLRWYADANGGLPLSSGAVFTTPYLTTRDTTFYVAAVGGKSISTLGKTLAPTVAGFATSGGYLSFNAFSDFSLDSVRIYPFSAAPSTGATLTIGLTNAAGTILQQTTVTGINGKAVAKDTTVYVGFAITPGSGYRLIYLSSTGLNGLLGDATGVTNYPFSLTGTASITASGQAGAAQAGKYNFFYNWSVGVGCESARQAITAHPTTAPLFDVTANIVACNNTTTKLEVLTTIDPLATYTWSPLTNLYIDALASTPYLGGNATAVYAKSPSASNILYTAYFANLSGCGASDTVRLKTQPSSTALVQPTVPICVSGSSTLNLVPATGYATGFITWRISTDDITYNDIPGQNLPNYTTDFLTSTRYYQAQIKSSTGVCFQTVTDTIKVLNVFVTPTADIRCGTGQDTLRALATAGAAVKWYTTIGTTPFATGLKVLSPSISANTNFLVEATLGTCTTSPRQSVLAQTTTASVLTLTPSQTICNGVTTMLAVTSPNANYDAYLWTPLTKLFLDAAGTIPYNGGISDTVYFISNTPGLATYTCNASNSVSNCATSATTDIYVQPAGVTINASPTAICFRGTSTVSITPSSGSFAANTVKWQDSTAIRPTWQDIPSATSNSYATPTLISSTGYRAIISNASTGTCFTPRYILNVNAPQLLSVGSSFDMCLGDSVSLTGVGSAGTTIQWFSSELGGTALASASPYKVSPASTTVYYAQAAIGTCASNAIVSGTPIILNPIRLQQKVAVAKLPTAIISSVLPDGVCTAGSPVTLDVLSHNGQTANSNWQFKWLSGIDSSVVSPFSATSSLATSSAAGLNKYLVVMDNITCPGLTDTALVPFYAGITASTNTTLATGCTSGGTISIDAAGAGGWATFYANNFTSATLNASEAALTPLAKIANGVCVIDTGAASKYGAFEVKNPNAVSSNEYSLSFDMITANPSASPADGFSFSFGNDVVAAVEAAMNAENGTGSKLKLGFVAYTNGTSVNGIYLMYNCTVNEQTPTTPGVLAYSNNVSWRATGSKTVKILINALGQVSVTLGGEAIFAGVQLPAAYLTANHGNWRHVFKARTGAEYLGMSIDNLNLQYRDFEYAVPLTTVAPSAWQNSKVWAVGPGVYDVWVRQPGNPTCATNVGTATVGFTSGTITTLSTLSSPLCNIQSPVLSLSIGTIPGATYQWQDSTKTHTWQDVGSATNSTYSPSVTDTSAFRCVISCGGSPIAQSPSTAIKFNVLLPQVSVPISTVTRCGAGPVTFNGIGSAGTTLKWYTGPSGGTATTGNSFTTLPITANTPFYVEATIGTPVCASTPRLPVQANVGVASPLTVTSPNPAVCNGGIKLLRVTSLASLYDSVTWSPITNLYKDAAATQPYTANFNADTVYVKSLTAAATTYTVSGWNTVSGCANTATLIVTVQPSVTASNATGTPSVICFFGTSNLVLTPATGFAAIQWQSATSVGGPYTDIPGSSAQAANYTSAFLSAPTFFKVLVKDADNNICFSKSVSVTVNTPQVTSTTSGSHCGPGSVSLAATASAGATLAWYAAPSGGIAFPGITSSYNTPSLSTTTNYYIAANIGTCVSSKAVATATITPGPTLSVAPVGVVCNNSPVMLRVNSDVTNFDTFVWSPTVDLYTDALCTIPYTGTNTDTVYFKGSTAGNTLFTVQGDKASSSCTNTANVSFYVQPAAATVSSFPSSICLSGTTTLTLQPTTGFAPNTFQWQSATNIGGPYTNITGAIAAAYVSNTINTTTYFKMVVKNSDGATCLEPIASITVNNPSITSATGNSRCGFGTLALTATGSAGTSIDWYSQPVGGTKLGSTISGNPFTTPQISTTTSYYAAASNGGGTALATIGTGILSNSTSSFPSPYGQFYGGTHEQYLILASELSAAGLSAGPIATIAFNQAAGYTYTTLSGYQLQMANTSLSNLTTSLVTTGFTTVYGPVNYNPGNTTGWTTINLTNQFVWDGASNVIVDYSFLNCSVCNGTSSCTTAFTSNGVVFQSATPFVSTVDMHADGNCTMNTMNPLATGAATPFIGTTYSQRPNMQFIGTVGCSSARSAVTATITPPPALTITAPATICNNIATPLAVTTPAGNFTSYIWSPLTNLYTNAAGTTPYLGGSATQVYFKSATPGKYTYYCTSSNSSNCGNIDTTDVTVMPGVITISQFPNAAICNSGSVKLIMSPSVSTFGTGSIQWQKSTTSLTAGFTNIVGQTGDTLNTGNLTATTYYRIVVKNSSGQSCTIQPTATVSVNAPALVTTVPGTRCGTGTVNLSATGSSGATIDWYSQAVGGLKLGSTLSGNPFTTPQISATTNYYASASFGGGSALATIGTGVLTNTTSSFPSPYGQFYGGTHEQYLILASELTAAGLSAGPINSIAFNQATGYTFTTLSGYQLQMANTSLSNLTSSLVTTGFTTVYGPVNYNPGNTTGWTTINFANQFVWDGASNVIVDYSFLNCTTCNLTSSCTTAFTSNGSVFQSATSFVSTVDMHADGNCTMNTMNPLATGGTTPFVGTTYSQRPNMQLFGTIGCSSLRTLVPATVTPPPAISASATPSTLCGGSSAVITASSANPGYKYTWAPVSLTGTSVSVTPNLTTTYTVSALDTTSGLNAGCTNVATVNVTVDAATAVLITPPTATKYPLQITQIDAAAGVVKADIGTGNNINTTTTFPTPYGQAQGSGHSQYLILASELLAQNVKPGIFTNIAFNLQTGYTYAALKGFKIMIAPTAATALTSSLITSGFTTCRDLGSGSYVPPTVAGWDTINLSNSFVWNGTSNVVVDISFSNCTVCNGTPTCTTTSTSNGVVFQSTTAFVSTVNFAASNNCTINSSSPSIVGTTYTQRPNIRFVTSAQTSFTWAPTTGLFTDQYASIPYTGGPATTVYSQAATTTNYVATSTVALGTCGNTAGTGVVNVISATPACVSTVNVLNANCVSTTQLSWTPVTQILQGYRVYVGTDGGGTTIPTSLVYDQEVFTATTFALPLLVSNTKYYYYIAPYNLNGENLSCSIDSFISGPDVSKTPNQTPTSYTETLDNGVVRPDLPCGVTVWDEFPRDGFTWYTSNIAPRNIPGSNHLRIDKNTVNTNIPKDDWVFSSPMNLVAGRLYKIYFWHRVNSLPATETFDIYWGSTADASVMSTTSTIFSGTSASINYTLDSTQGILPQTTGTYFYGIRATGAASGGKSLYLDDIQVKEIAVAALTPGSCDTIPNMYQQLFVQPVLGATDYKFLIENGTLGFSYQYTRNLPIPDFRLKWAPGVRYADTTGRAVNGFDAFDGVYSVAVAYKKGGSWSLFGAPCDVRMGPFPKTKLRGGSCGAVLSDTYTQLNIDSVPGATNYEFGIIQDQIGYNHNWLRNQPSLDYRLYWAYQSSPTLVDRIPYGYTYKIVVRAQAGYTAPTSIYGYNEGSWGYFGDTCTVTLLGQPQTQLSPTSCGALLSNINDRIFCVAVTSAGNYRYKVYTSAGNDTMIGIRNSALNDYRLTWLPTTGGLGVKYNTTYHVRVSDYVAGTWSAYGPECDVTTPASPLTQLQPAYCAYTLPTFSSPVYCNAVLGATNYRYRITDVATNGATYTKIKDRNQPSNDFRFSWTLVCCGGQNMLPNTSYKVEVASYAGGVWSGYGNVCTITTGASVPRYSPFLAEEGLEEAAQALSLNVYPNPAAVSEEYAIEINGISAANERIQVDIYSILGERVYRSEIVTKEESRMVIKPESSLAPGVYMVEAKLNGHTYREKFVVK